jgi:hypothetical protein
MGDLSVRRSSGNIKDVLKQRKVLKGMIPRLCVSVMRPVMRMRQR